MNTIKLDTTNYNQLTDYLKILEQGTNIECEIRFGTILYSKNTSPTFLSEVEPDFFYKLKSKLDISYESNLPQKHIINTKELSYNNIRKIIHMDNHTHTETDHIEYMVKKSKKSFTNFQYGYKLGLSEETLLNKQDGEKIINLSEPTYIRYKFRTSYVLSCGKLDLTIVHQGKNEEEATKNTSYEIEFEINKNDYNCILQILSLVLQVKQQNTIVIDNNEKSIIIKEYKTMTKQISGRPRFIGAQPETLHKDQLTKLFKEVYSVTDKADGERYFLFIGPQGNVSFIDNNISNILKTDVTSSIKNCIIDGELIKHDGKISFYAFDILIYNNIDLRGNKDYLLKKRLEYVNICINQLSTSENFKIEIKKFIYRNVFMGAEILMKDIANKPYENDGVIFTPMNEPYPTVKKAPNWLKWKPAELNTIDFFSKKIYDSEGNSKWQLYIQTPNTDINNKDKDKTLALFDINKFCNNQNTTDITFETTFDENLIDPTTNTRYKTDTVIEYKWDKILNKFIPLRTRWDKTPFGKIQNDPRMNKRGNFITVACSIWDNIHNPITSSQLFQMTNSTTNTVNNENLFFLKE